MAPRPAINSPYQPIWKPMNYTAPTEFTVNDSMLYRNHMRYLNRRFDEIALKHYVASSGIRRRQTYMSEHSSHRSTSPAPAPVVSKNGDYKGFEHELRTNDYEPHEIDITLPEEGKLLLKGKKPGIEFEETIDLPGDVDDEEVSIVINSEGKLLVRAPYL